LVSFISFSIIAFLIMKKCRIIQIVNFPGVDRRMIDYLDTGRGILMDALSNFPKVLERQRVEEAVISNKGWKDGQIPNVISLERTEEGIVFTLGGNVSYSLHQAHFKHVLEDGGEIVTGINPLSTETIPITSDNHIILFQRSMDLTHGPGLYNFASGYNADIYLEKIKEFVEGEVTTRDLWVFSLWKLFSEIGVKPEEAPYDDMMILGFSKGFELSLDFQVNFSARLGVGTEELTKRLIDGDFPQSSNFRVITNDVEVLLELFNYVDTKNVPKDIYGNKFLVNLKTGRFGFTDDAYGTLIQHMRILDPSKAESAVEILKRKGYEILEMNVTTPGQGVYLL